MLDIFALAGDSFDSALEIIKATDRNRVICSVTGVPYATIDDSEIMDTLKIEWRESMGNVDRLIDQWDMRHWAMSSRPAPSLRLIREDTMGHHLAVAKNSESKLFAYLLTRLLFPADAVISFERFTFLREFQQQLATQEGFPAAGMAGVAFSQLAQVDAIRSLRDWLKSADWNKKHAKQLDSLRSGNWPTFFATLRNVVESMYSDAIDWAAGRDESSESKGNALMARAVTIAPERLASARLIAAEVHTRKMMGKINYEAAPTGSRVMKRPVASMGQGREKKPVTPLTEKQKKNAAVRSTLDAIDWSSSIFAGLAK